MCTPMCRESKKSKSKMKLDVSRTLLGKGGYGFVFLGTLNGQQVAVKRVQLDDTDPVDNEEKVLQQLNHPNVVRLFYCHTDDDFKYFALELCQASLDKLFLKPENSKKYKGPVLPHHSTVFSQLVSGLEYIHSNDLIHRDIKPENVLISVDTNTSRITMKLADFGLSRYVNERGTFTMSSGIKGTRKWFAPELLKLIRFQQPETMGQPRGTVKSDVFSLGLVFGYFLLSGQHLYGSDEFQICDNIIEKKAINTHQIDRSHYVRCLIQKMLADNPNDRISSSDAVGELKLICIQINKTERELWELCSSRITLDLNQIKQLILLGVDVNGTDNEGWNILHLLCLNHSGEKLMDAIKLLIHLGIDVTRKSNDGWNALHILCLNNSSGKLIEVITSLIHLGIDLHERDSDGWNALHNLCLNNSNERLIDALRFLMELEIDVNVPTNTGKNALHYLCQYQMSDDLIDAMQLLIEHGIDFCGKTNTRRNALHLLCQFNSSKRLIDAIKLLIQHGIDVNEKDNTNRNALLYLCQYNSSANLIEAITLLIQNGIYVNEKDTSGLNALHYLCICNSSENLIDAIKLLIEHGIDVNHTDNGGFNALHCLCEHSFSETLIDAIQLLIELGIDKNGTTNTGKNALHCLCRFSSNERLIDAVELLIQHGNDVESNGIDARSLIRNNYRKDNIEDVIQLLDRAQFFRALPFFAY